MGREEGGGLGRKEAGKRKTQRPWACCSPGLMCKLKLRGEEGGSNLQLKQMSLGNLSAEETKRLLSETLSGLFLWAVLTSCFEEKLGI